MKDKKTMNRRKFINMVAAGTCGAACHHILRPASSIMAYAAQPTGPIKNYVELFFYGGCCSYGLFPKHNVGAQAKMGNLYRTPAQAAYIGSPDMSMHQAFAPMIAEVNATGNHLAVICGAGPADANGGYTRSHDEGQIANQRLSLSYQEATGLGVGAAIADAIAHPFGLVSFDGASDFTVGGAYPSHSLASLENGGKPDFWQDDWFGAIDAAAKSAAAPPKSDEQAYLRNAIYTSGENLLTLQSLASLTPPIAFPNTGIGSNFEDVTRLIMSNIGARVFAIGIGGFDTHSGQLASHQNSFTQINAALLAFVRNLKAIPGVSAANAWEETVVVERSDFGGRTFTNGADGTDHGYVGEQFAIGGRVKGGIYGDIPNAAKFQNETQGYPGPSWLQFSSMQMTKELVLYGMGLNVPFPNYYGNKYTPLGVVL